MRDKNWHHIPFFPLVAEDGIVSFLLSAMEMGYRLDHDNLGISFSRFSTQGLLT